jgi:hypothetical protein
MRTVRAARRQWGPSNSTANDGSSAARLERVGNAMPPVSALARSDADAMPSVSALARSDADAMPSDSALARTRPPTPSVAEPAPDRQLAGGDAAQSRNALEPRSQLEHGSECPRQRGRQVPAALRRAVFERDEARCRVCKPGARGGRPVAWPARRGCKVAVRRSAEPREGLHGQRARFSVRTQSESTRGIGKRTTHP